MTQILSARRTLWVKIFPFLGIAAITVVSLIGLRGAPRPTEAPPMPFDFMHGPVGVIFQLLGYAFWGAAAYAGWRLKSVRVEGDLLKIGGLFREITVPLHQVAEVGTALFGKFARIDLHGATDFGESIWFIPTGGSEGLFQPAHSVLTLRAMVGERMGDRAAALPPAVDFAASWSRLRKWQWAHHFGILGFLVVGGVTVLYRPRDPFVMLYLLPFIILTGATGKVISNWACPKCGERFYGMRPGFKLPSLFGSKCGHCGLPKGQLHASLPTPNK